ncbi:hypothetical protein Francci3_3902 [Frankia casuarinae]|uniref:Uncharacterized protein n=1 Tax=Frankia casuarinae (strain DSM 45818 / CECT 9043 / HFP020203 / CcI3) TaxID=106370 RepID=Q2J640_FRACC|nr:hypothetical protein Francci3_3902 [Frankia casuarinae]
MWRTPEDTRCEDVPVNEVFAASVLVERKIDAGAVGLLVVLALIAASSVIFFFLSKSLRRMRSNVASGEFAGVDPDPNAMRRLDGGDGPVIDGEVVEETAGTAGAGSTAGLAGGGEQLDLPTQPGPPAGSAGSDR